MTRVADAGPGSARAIIDAGRYMTLATADARHSRNLAVRPELAIVIFDTTVPPGRGQAVYMAARAEQTEPADLRVFSERSIAQGLGAWTADELGDRLRPYRAVVSQHWMLGEDRDERVPVSP